MVSDCAQQLVEHFPLLAEGPDPKAGKVCVSPALNGVRTLRERPGAEKTQSSRDEGCDGTEVDRKADVGARHCACHDRAECPQAGAEAERDDAVCVVDKPYLPRFGLFFHRSPQVSVDNHPDRMMSRIVGWWEAGHGRR